MSWDVFIYAADRPPPPVADMPADWKPSDMGPPDALRDRLSAVAPQIDWSSPLDGVLIGDDFHAELHIGNTEGATDLALHLGGGPAASAFVRDVLQALGAYAIDSSAGEWMHHMTDPDAGRAQFASYLAEVRARTASAPPNEPPSKRAGWVKRLFGRKS